VIDAFDAGNSECRVYVRRAGLLAAVGHDLEIRVTEYRVELDRGAAHVSARFAAASLCVVDAVEGRRRCPGRLSARDKSQIESSICEHVLCVAVHPTIEFRSTAIASAGDEHHVRGTLTLLGRTRELSFVVTHRADELIAEVVVHQPDFAITPFSAVAGALRVRPEVTIEFRAPLSARTKRQA
jgi:hypothetical protein